jgi:hypothetical protein
MNSYRVWIQIKQTDCSGNHPRSIGQRYEAGQFSSQAEAVRFVKNDLMIVRPVKRCLQKLCRAGLKFLDSLPVTKLTGQRQKRQAFRKMLTEALSRYVPLIDDRCPKCGAGSKDRQLVGREFLLAGTIHVHYRCNRCGSRIVEQFKRADVFIDNPSTS